MKFDIGEKSILSGLLVAALAFAFIPGKFFGPIGGIHSDKVHAVLAGAAFVLLSYMLQEHMGNVANANGVNDTNGADGMNGNGMNGMNGNGMNGMNGNGMNGNGMNGMNGNGMNGNGMNGNGMNGMNGMNGNGMMM